MHTSETASGSAGARLSPIRHVNLDDKVYARVKDMIASGDLEPGSRIVQEDLAANLGVSRTPLVNALKRLAQEGLLEWVPRRGIYVRQLGLQELVWLFELRERLEPLAAELAAARIEPGEAREMRRQWAAMADMPDTPESHRTFVDLDRRFHWRLAELAANPYLSAAMAPVNMMAAAYLHGAPRPWEDTVPDHLAVIDALERGDAAACGEAMRAHIAQSLEALRGESQGAPAAATGISPKKTARR
ncbi:GntR family transcriptional regulator [Fundidesulfovibrio terrae]|uniref:GntR family transcriptional regulator n=1 Tax=Fundidesulfovibrio terrae TaxID=2922866 RepID=UPI001FAFF216|nr:GntR family transcriptional regulator [Fundidesulfovibrio terrae]